VGRSRYFATFSGADRTRHGGGTVIRVTIEVIEDSRRCLVTVCADDIRRALELVRDRYGRGRASVVFPLDPEVFLVKEGAIELSVEEAGTPGASGPRPAAAASA
jgi:hypothetical protein